MRIALDMQACQTESRWRGIGRYALSLSRELVAQADDSREFIIGLDGTYGESAMQIASEFSSRLLPSQTIRYHYPKPRFSIGATQDVLRPAAESFVRQAYASMSPDVIHVHSLFEGFIEDCAGLGELSGIPGALSSVILYDLIPAIFPDQYLQDDVLRKWYRRKLRDLQRFDVVLCISESTRDDAIRLLGLPAERLFVIDAGVSPQLLGSSRADFNEQALRKAYGIEGRFVLYTGNGDARKNVPAAVEAFASVPSEQRAGVQLVLNQVGDERALLAIAEKVGLAKSDLVITGRIDDANLTALQHLCDVFFFPSLYEGFGLPVLEAMACGAAVIAADNSSLPEVVGRRDALFDANSLQSMTACLAKALTDDAFRHSLAADARSRAGKFTWERTARLAVQAWDQSREGQRRSNCGPRRSGKRWRIAMVTPVPPQRTGIADYVDELLPCLAGRMKVDIFTSDTASVNKAVSDLCDVFHWSRLLELSLHYDEVIYQFGNSPFHSHMLELLDKVPGLVVMHDLYLSSMLSHMDEHEGQPGVFGKELRRSHGLGAQKMLGEEGGRDRARQLYPASLRVFERADAVISHSRHFADLCQKFYPGMRRGPIVHAPMPRSLATMLDPDVRNQARLALGVAADAFLVVSLGFIADTKLTLETIQAMADPRLVDDQRIHMLFVGGNDVHEYGRVVLEALAEHPLRDRIAITGYVSNEQYAQYLSIADVAIQLRAGSRGETSKSVLDCLANGVPVIVNEYGSFVEIPDDAVEKLAVVPTPAEIADTVSRWASDPSLLSQYGSRGRAYVEAWHSPYATASAYEYALELARGARGERNGKRLSIGIADAMSTQGDTVDLAMIEAALHASETVEPAAVYIDVSEVVRIDYRTGIQRVVRNLARELSYSEDPRYDFAAVELDGSGGLKEIEEKAREAIGMASPWRQGGFAPRPGDSLFLLDSSWEKPERFLPGIELVRKNGGKVYAMVYDLIPLRWPQYCVDYMPWIFENWLRLVIRECDGLVCISRAVADDLKGWIGEVEAEYRDGLRIGHIQLGSDVSEGLAPSPPSEAVRAAMGESRAAVVMIGTLEPRKRHDVALDAFDLIWRAGSDKRLVIIGKRGWNVDETVDRIQNHPQLGKALFWLQGLSDDDIMYAYTHAERLLQTSDAEGFGLPLVEALRQRCPVLATDLAVFHEVAGAAADYFPPGDAQALARQLGTNPKKVDVDIGPSATWAQSASQFLDLISGDQWDYRL